VNASRAPGQWQAYDIIFHGPHFDKDGKVLRPARVTVLHNGVLVQDNVELSGPTGHHVRPPYKPTPDKLPLGLQDHGNPVRSVIFGFVSWARDSRSSFTSDRMGGHGQSMHLLLGSKPLNVPGRFVKDVKGLNTFAWGGSSCQRVHRRCWNCDG